jgi:hypothetical protein
MGALSYMRSVGDRNVVMRHIPVLGQFLETGDHNYSCSAIQNVAMKKAEYVYKWVVVYIFLALSVCSTIRENQRRNVTNTMATLSIKQL